MRGEVEVKDNAIANLENQLSGVVAENKDQVLTIANLENQLSGVISELKERDVAIAKLKSELESQGEVKQLNLFPESKPTPEPTPEPEPTPPQGEVGQTPAVEVDPQPESNPGQIDFTGTIPRGELVSYINKNFPGIDFKGHHIGDCFCINKKTGKIKSSKLSTHESNYGFKYVGIFEGEHRFRLNSKP